MILVNTSEVHIALYWVANLSLLKTSILWPVKLALKERGLAFLAFMITARRTN